MELCHNCHHIWTYLGHFSVLFLITWQFNPSSFHNVPPCHRHSDMHRQWLWSWRASDAGQTSVTCDQPLLSPGASLTSDLGLGPLDTCGIRQHAQSTVPAYYVFEKKNRVKNVLTFKMFYFSLTPSGLQKVAIFICLSVHYKVLFLHL